MESSIWFFGLLLGIMFAFGGCECCGAFCQEGCTQEVSIAQFTISGATADDDTSGCCGDVNATYVIDAGQGICGWGSDDIYSSECDTGPCTGADCDVNGTCGNGQSPPYCFDNGDCANTVATFVVDASGAECNDTEECGATADPTNPCTGTCTAWAGGPYGATWPDPLPGDAPAGVSPGDTVKRCEWAQDVIGSCPGSCGSVYSHITMQILKVGTDAVLRFESGEGNVINNHYFYGDYVIGAAPSACELDDVDIFGSLTFDADCTTYSPGKTHCLCSNPTAFNVTVAP